MMAPRGWCVMAIVGMLAVVGIVMGQTQKVETVVIRHTLGPQAITVNDSQSCVDNDDQPAYTNGSDSDTVQWNKGPRVAGFQIIFPRKSPSGNGERFFDSSSKPFKATTKPKKDAEVFEYVIAVDLANGTHFACDPHVIVVKGSGVDSN